VQRIDGLDYITIPRKPKRDRYGRPRVWLPGFQPDLSGTAEAEQANDEAKRSYTRCTKFIDVIDDEYQLVLWKLRQVLRGAVMAEDVVLSAAGLGPQPDKFEAHDGYVEWREKYNKLTRELTNIARSGAKANIGDALHAFSERLDRGLDVDPREVPERYHQHLRNYMAATAELRSIHIERFMVCDELGVGGTPDRVLLDERDRIVIGDVKTGNVDYDPEKIARQLAIYSRSQFYDDATGRRWLDHPIDQEWGTVIKLDARTGICELIDVNLTEGWEGVLTCQRVRSERNRKVTVRPHISPNAPVLPSAEEVTPETLAAIITAIGAAPSPEALDQIWQAAAHLWTEAMTERVKERLGELTLEAAGPMLTVVSG
jgi:hypothetical protein